MKWPFARRSRRYTNFGDHHAFVSALYDLILGREPDAGGLDFHVGRLARNEIDRDNLVRDFILSEECRQRCHIKFPFQKILHDYRQVADPAPFRPHVLERPFAGPRLCELANPRKWLDEAWWGVIREGMAINPALDDMHRKTYEFVQTVYGLRLLGRLGPGDRVLCVGAGHEMLLYWLANRVDEVVATDLYEGAWCTEDGREGDPGVLVEPARFAPFPYRQECLRFLRMDGRCLEFPDDSFDAVYSLSAIEHFGGHAGAGRAMAEMGRVLKPGGVAAVATELVVNDREHRDYFTPKALLEYVVAPAGLQLVQEPEFKLPVYALEHPIRLPQEAEFRPHIVLKQRQVLFTSVMLFFQKTV